MAISAKHSILDVWQGSDYTSRLLKLLCHGSRGIHGKIDICQTYIRSKLKTFPYSEVTWKYNIQAKEKAMNHWIWCFCSLFYFLHSTVPDNKCDKQKWYMLFFTCIKIVVHVLACAHPITYIKWRRLPLFHKGKEIL